MNQLELKDSIIDGIEPWNVNYKNASDFIHAIEELKKQFASGKIDCIHLCNYGNFELGESPINVAISSYTKLHNSRVPDKCSFSTSHYIGFYGDLNVSIRIVPRFGDLFSYFLGYAANVFLPVGESGLSPSGGNAYWLLAILWKSLLNNALTTGQIPKIYIEERKNINNYRGRLDFHQNIMKNLVDQSKFFCVYRKLSMDNTINRAVRHTYRVLKEKGLNNVLADMAAFDQRLESFGVKDNISELKELDNIRYTRMNAVYKPVVNICRTIIRNEASSFEGGDRKNFSYMIDVAELWELYLLRLLQRNLSSEYYVYSPNAVAGSFLLEGDLRSIRPDILIEKDNRVVLIIDAKYKHYSHIGKTASSYASVQRDDLYQMNTYLYHYGKGRSLAGIFTSPVAETEQNLHRYANNPNHRIGVVNLDIKSCGNDMEKIHAAENLYIDRIKRILSENPEQYKWGMLKC